TRRCTSAILGVERPAPVDVTVRRSVPRAGSGLNAAPVAAATGRPARTGAAAPAIDAVAPATDATVPAPGAVPPDVLWVLLVSRAQAVSAAQPAGCAPLRT